MSKTLPADITSYDLLKSLAIFIMIVDHIGAYFYPDVLWWRAFGSSPVVWIPLIGYTRNRNISVKLVVGALILIGTDFVVGGNVFPFNILVTVIVIRLVLDKLAYFTFDKNIVCFWVSFIGLLSLWWPTQAFFFEYGTLALCVALFGFSLRNKESLKRFDDLERIFVVSFLFYIVTQSLIFDFSKMEFILMVVTTFGLFSMMYMFKPQTYPKFTKSLPKSFVWLIHLGGRRTLEIYVIHLIIFKFVAVYMGMEGYQLFDWKWM